jgi:hypothetical protein
MSLLELIVASCGVGLMICIVPLALHEFKQMLDIIRGG